MSEFSETEKIILTIMGDGKLYSCETILDISRRNSMTKLKEVLLELLKKEAVCCHGNHWQLKPGITPPRIDVDLKVSELTIRCPGCSELLDVPAEHIGRKVCCPVCSTRFRVSNEKLSPSQFRAIPL